MRTGALQLGERYGSLTITGEVVERGPRGVPEIECTCSCTAVVRVATHRLKSGAARACAACTKAPAENPRWSKGAREPAPIDAMGVPS